MGSKGRGRSQGEQFLPKTETGLENLRMSHPHPIKNLAPSEKHSSLLQEEDQEQGKQIPPWNHHARTIEI